MAEKHRMIGTGAKTRKQAHPASASALGDTHRTDEVFAAKVRGATEGHQEAARIKRAEGQRVEFDVEMFGAPRVGARARKWRRIKHDQIETLIALTQEDPRFTMHEANGACRIAIELKIALRPVECVRRSVNGDGLRRAALQRVQGEAAGVAAQIEHAGAGGERTEARPVFALIEKRAALLAMLEVNDHLYAVLANPNFTHAHFGGGSIRDYSDGILESLLPAHRALTALENRARRDHRLEPLDDLIAYPLGARGQQLHHRDIAVAVGDDAREAVAVAV